MKKRISQKVLKDNIELGVLALPTIILLALFSYWPMFGTILAFKDYKVKLGILGSEWVGFKYFEKDLQGIHFEKVYSPYYQQKGGVTFDSLERGKLLVFEK